MAHVVEGDQDAAADPWDAVGGSGLRARDHKVRRAHACMRYNTPYCMDGQRQVRAMPAAQRLSLLTWKPWSERTAIKGPFLKGGTGAEVSGHNYRTGIKMVKTADAA